MELDLEAEQTSYVFKLALTGAELEELLEWFKSLPSVHLNPNHGVAINLRNRLDDTLGGR